METTDASLRAVLDAARCLLAAREDGMLTSIEWEALQEAVEGCDQAEPRAGSLDADNRTA